VHSHGSTLGGVGRGRIVCCCGCAWRVCRRRRHGGQTGRSRSFKSSSRNRGQSSRTPPPLTRRATKCAGNHADGVTSMKWSGWWDCCAALGPSGTALRCSLLLPLVAARTHFVASHPTHPTNSVELVGVVGFEPTTYSSQSYRAARLRYTPSKRNVDNAFSWLVCQLLMLAYFACFVALAR
jgi:hypothetical protein